MSKQVVLDASAIIALINKEPGWEIVRDVLPYSLMSSVNVAEVAKFLIHYNNYNKDEARLIIEQIIDEIINFSPKQAYISAEIFSETKNLGLSLGDRSCLALAIDSECPVYTADQIWKKLELDKISIKIIRTAKT